MRKVKLIPQDDGSFKVEGDQSYPELKGKKLVILTKGLIPKGIDDSSPDSIELEGDEAIILTQEEFDATQGKLKEKPAEKGKEKPSA